MTSTVILTGHWGDQLEVPVEPVANQNIKVTKKDGKVFYLSCLDAMKIVTYWRREELRKHLTTSLSKLNELSDKEVLEINIT